MKILITGGTGFIGRALCRSLIKNGHQITVLSRQPEYAASVCGKQVKAIKSTAALDLQSGFDAIINLAGTPIAETRWTNKRKQLLRDSRLQTTRKLIDYIAHSRHKPGVLINASAIGFYGDHGDIILDETSDAVSDFAHQLCADWEAEANKASEYGVRVCLLRIGLVIGKQGGFLKRMLLPFKLGLGGRMGSGKQWMSWIHQADLIAMIEKLLLNEKLTGAYNGTAPNPVTNQEFTSTLAEVLRRPAIVPAPAWLLKLVFGEMATLLLGGQRVIPRRFLDEGFVFRYETLPSALQAALSD